MSENKITFESLKERGLTEEKDLILVAHDGCLAMSFTFGEGQWSDFLTNVNFTMTELVFYTPANDPLMKKIKDWPVPHQRDTFLFVAIRMSYDAGKMTHYSSTLPTDWSESLTKAVILHFLDFLVNGPGHYDRSQ